MLVPWHPADGWGSSPSKRPYHTDMWSNIEVSPFLNPHSYMPKSSRRWRGQFGRVVGWSWVASIQCGSLDVKQDAFMSASYTPTVDLALFPSGMKISVDVGSGSPVPYDLSQLWVEDENGHVVLFFSGLPHLTMFQKRCVSG